VADGVAQTLAEACRSEAGGGAVLEAVQGALLLTDHLIRRFATTAHIPHPIACGPGCGFCCYNQVEVTPPEALLVGHFITTRFSTPQRQWLDANLKRRLALKQGLSRIQLAARRREHPCPLLADHRCIIYPVRPLACRAMHSLDADACRHSLETGELIPDRYYQEPHDLALAVSAGLRNGAAQAGLQADTLNLTAALANMLPREDVLAGWVAGEAIFGGEGQVTEHR
jgi:hypothetical protein